MVNPFQQGQAFEQRQFAGEQQIEAASKKQEGINALADLYGQQFLAPGEAVAATGAVESVRRGGAREEQRQINNARIGEMDAQKQQDRERQNALGAAQNVVNLAKLNTANNVPVEQTIQQIQPAMEALGVAPQEQEQIIQGLQGEDPSGFLGSLEGMLTQQRQAGSVARPTAGVDAEGNPVFFRSTTQGPEIIPGISPPPRSSAPLEANRLRELKNIGSDLSDARKVLKGNQLAVEAGKTVIRDVDTALDLAAKNPLFGAKQRGDALEDDSFLKSAGRAVSGFVYGADTREIQKLVDSVKANVGIDSLLKIKASGAGLGQVPQSQLEVLQSLLGNLDPTRRPEFFLRDLRDIKELYTTMNEALKQDSSSQRDRQQQLKQRRDVLEGRKSSSPKVRVFNPATGRLE